MSHSGDRQASHPLSAAIKTMSDYFIHLNLNSSDPSSDSRVIFPGGFVNSITGASTGPISSLHTHSEVYNQLILPPPIPKHQSCAI